MNKVSYAFRMPVRRLIKKRTDLGEMSDETNAGIEVEQKSL